MRALGGFFDKRGVIKVDYEFAVVDGFDTSVGECCWRTMGGWKECLLYDGFDGGQK